MAHAISRLGTGALVLALAGCGGEPPAETWSVNERAQIASLWIGRLGPPPADPSNRHADRADAAALGRTLFFDPRLSANGQITCASCHRPERAFSDGLPVASGLNLSRRNTPSLLGAAWSPWLFWDGRADSLWSQAAGPLLHADEMGMTAAGIADVIAAHYRDEYEALFGPLPRAGKPERVLTNVGKALAAFVRTLRPAAGRFDAYAQAIDRNAPDAGALLSAPERTGLKLFLGRAQCLRCHHSPLFSNHGFHNTGLAPLPGRAQDLGRVEGAQIALASRLNCRGPYNDSIERHCPHLDYLRADVPEQVGAFKTPSLRHVGQTAPYMHDGRFGSLREVLNHYNLAPGLGRAHGHTELFPLALSATELEALEAFLGTLGPSPLAPDAKPD